MLFRQLVNEDLGCASYLVGCEAAGEAVVVDPPLAIEELLEVAARHDVRIVRTIETHTHADHVSGHGRLALEHGIPVSIHPIAAVEYPHDPFADDDSFRVGNVSLRCLHTPGHRPEHCCVTVIDHTRADEPWLVLTGDSLFVGDTARPDLAVGGIEGATALFASLRRLLELSDGVEVYPGHVSGSLCGKGMSSKSSSTIGFERRFNPMLAFSELAAFVAESAAVEAPKPPNLARIVATNHGPFEAAADPVCETRSTPDEVQLLDVRASERFLAGHSPGAVNVPLAGSAFATKAGFALDLANPVHLLVETTGQASRAASALFSVACAAVTGYTMVDGGPERLDDVSIDELEELYDRGTRILDVRDGHERSPALPRIESLPFSVVRTHGSFSPGEEVVTVCTTGARAAIAASMLRARGIAARPVVVGGIPDLARRLEATAATVRP